MRDLKGLEKCVTCKYFYGLTLNENVECINHDGVRVIGKEDAIKSDCKHFKSYKENK